MHSVARSEEKRKCEQDFEIWKAKVEGVFKMSFSKAKFYRNQMVKNADGLKLWKKLELSGKLDDENYDEGLVKMCSETSQKLESECIKFEERSGPYAAKRGNPTPAYNATRERLYNALIAQMKKSYPKEFVDDFWAEVPAPAPKLKTSEALEEFQDRLLGMLDAANSLYSSWATAQSELPAEQRIQYTNDTREQLVAIEKKFASAQAQVIATHPLMTQQVYEASKPFVSIVRGHKQAYADDHPVHTVL